MMLERGPRFTGSDGSANPAADRALYTDPRWDAWSRIDADAVAVVRRHPRFADALRAFATSAVALYRGSRLINLLTNDRGRALLAMFAVYLHYTRRPDDPASGLTAARLQSLFVETGLGSAGRAKALITLMRWGGYVEDAPASRDRRVKVLQPTEKMLAMHRERWRGALGAAGLMLPEAAQAHARFDEPGFLRAYAIAQVSEFQGGFRLLDHGPELQLFSDRNAGFPIMFSILLSAPPEDGMPPTGAIPVSASALAKRFHVSRTQVTRLLHDAQAAGLLERSGTTEMRVRFTPRFAENFEKLFGSLLLAHAACARHALGDIDAA
jgi:DNA-binding MarR family transcriptional regulator